MYRIWEIFLKNLNMQFRYDINGLRAIAVLAVVIFHFNPTWLAGGFAGVDVFFVISGFLMTSIIFNGLEKHTFNFFKFYSARANRIIPVLAAVSIVLMVFGWFYLVPSDYRELGKQVEKSILFTSNIFFSHGGGYFDSDDKTKWLLHTWSLSVEWQFYIFFPIIMVVLKKYLSVANLKRSILALFIIGFVYCIYATHKNSQTSYFLISSRAWEMLLGGLAFLYPVSIRNLKLKLSVQVAGIGLIVSSYFLISKNTPWPGYMALFPVLGAYLVIISNVKNNFILNNFIFNKIGSWSYSIYVWHWPLVVLGLYFSFSDWWKFGIPLSILLGFLSYQFIEKIKFSTFTSWKEIYKVKPFYFFLIIVLAGYTIKSTKGLDFEKYWRLSALSEQAAFLDFYKNEHLNIGETYWLKCNTYNSLLKNKSFAIDPICISNKAKNGVFLWGDSHAEALSFGLRHNLNQYDIPFYQQTSAGCRPSLKEVTRLDGLLRQACDHSNKEALENIKKLKPKIVILAQANDHQLTDWNEIYQVLIAHGVRTVILVGPVSQWQPSLPQVMIKPKNWRSTEELIYDEGLDMEVIETDKKMTEIQNKDHIQYISLIKDLCQKDTITAEYKCRVRASKERKLLQVDYGHLSDSGSLFVVNTIIFSKLLELYNKPSVRTEQ